MATVFLLPDGFSGPTGPYEVGLGFLPFLGLSSSSRTAAPGSRRSRFSNIPETFLQALSRVSLAGWFVADAGGDVCFLSDRFKDIAGRAEEALLGNGWQNALAAEDRPRVEAEWRSAVDRGRGWRSEFRLRRPDGGTAGVRGQAEPERDGRGRVRRFVGTLTELSERKEVETAVREKSRLLETVFDYSVSCQVLLDRDYNFIRVNETYARACRREVSEFVGKNHFDLYPSNAKAIFDEVVRTKQPYQTQARPFVFPDHPEWGITFWDWTLVPVLDDRGEVELLIFSLNEVTERVRVEEQLKRARDQLEVRVEDRTAELKKINERLQREIQEHRRAAEALQRVNRQTELILNSSSDGIVGVDLEGRITFVNPAAVRMTGHSPAELEGAPVDRFFSCGSSPQGQASLGCPIRRSLQEKTGSPRIEAWLLGKPGALIPVEYRCAPLLEKGKPVGGVITFRDVTEQRLGEQRIRESLRVKDLLLKEIHHRVKNNMQVISSMLWLQGKDIRQKKYAALFQDCSNRILSMALLHEKLYESSNLSKIDFKDYGASLMRDLAASYGTDADRVEMKIESENVFLDWNAGVPCGLLIQELVSNSLKHAFPRKRKGEIRVSLRPVKGKKLELIVADNGVGFPQGMDFRNTRSLGLQLVTTLAEKQLGGTVRWKRKNKTEFRMIFKETWP